MTMDSPSEARSATVSIFELAGCSGLELVARLADGSIRRPPVAETLPFTLLPPEEGKVGLLATPEPRFCNLTNTVVCGNEISRPLEVIKTTEHLKRAHNMGPCCFFSSVFITIH